MSDQQPPTGSEPPQPPQWGGGATPPPQQPPAGGGQGSYPPPPPVDYGQGGPSGMQQPYSPTDAVGWGWTKFKQNVGPLLLAILLIVAIQVAFGLIGSAVGGDGDAVSTDTGFSASYNLSPVGVVLQIVSWVIGTLITAGVIRACLAVASGDRFDIGKVFTADKVVPILLAALMTSVLTVIGLVLCILPGLVVIFFTQYVYYFILDRDAGAWDAITGSFGFVKDNFGPVFLYSLLAFLIIIAGALLCGVGLLVAGPIVVLGHAYTYRKLSGQPVAA